MLHTLENDTLKIVVDSLGAQLLSLYSKKTNTEYLWQGDPAFWTGRAYNIFPFIGRMYGGVYHYRGDTYPSRAHGLVRYFDLALETQGEHTLTFLLTDSEETKKEYPFSFEFRVIYTLSGNQIVTKYTVKNKDSRELLCRLGGHPGINVPFDGGRFEDYYLEFPNAGDDCRQIYENPAFFLERGGLPKDMNDEKKIPLHRELFVNDAILFEKSGGEVLLKTDKSPRYVSMRYPDYPFIAFWQVYKEGAPYICLEPWSAYSTGKESIIDIETEPFMIRVPEGKEKSMSFELSIWE